MSSEVDWSEPLPDDAREKVLQGDDAGTGESEPVSLSDGCSISECYASAETVIDHPGRPHEGVTPVCSEHRDEAVNLGASEVSR